MFVEPSTVLSTGATLYENRSVLLEIARKLGFLLTKGSLRVAVFGAGGVGKSTLGELISAGKSRGVSPEKYVESLSPEVYPIAGDLVGKLMVPPGQERRIDDYWPELYASLSQGDSKGIINVVSYGLHSFESLSLEETKYYREGMSVPEFVATYSAARREHELELLSEIVPRVIDAEARVWMLTLVTKQDIWWNQREEVQRFYTEGAYAEQVSRIVQKRGERNFSHEFASVSLVMSNFISGTGQLLLPTTGGYDQNLQLAHELKLLQHIRAFAEQ